MPLDMGIGLGMQVGSNTRGLLTPRSEQFKLGATRIHFPRAKSSAIIAGREFMTSRIRMCTPGYASREWWIFFPNFFIDEGATQHPNGLTNQETDIANSHTVWASVETGGIFYLVDFGNGPGQSYTMPAGSAGVWGKVASNFLPIASTNTFVRTISNVAIGDVRPIGFARQSGNSEAAFWSATNDTSLLTGGTITNSASGNYYGPACAAHKGNDGRLVYLIAGNSIDSGEDENAALIDTRGNLGFWSRGLDDAGSRLPYAMFASPGTRPSGQNSLLEGRFRHRNTVLQFAGGNLFDRVIGLGAENDANASAAAWLASWQSQIDFFTNQYNKPIIIRDILPKSSITSNRQWTNTANQTAEADARGTVNQQLNTLTNVKGVVGVNAEIADATTPTKWKVRPFSDALDAQANSGATSLNIGAAPALGEYVILGDGTAGFSRSTVIGNSNVAAISINPGVNATFPIASAIVAGPTDDGVHPSTAVHIATSTNIVIPAKGGVIS